MIVMDRQVFESVVVSVREQVIFKVILKLMLLFLEGLLSLPSGLLFFPLALLVL